MSQTLETEQRMTGSRRSAFEVRMDILKVAANGVSKPTHIMYRSNTSWVILQKNLEALRASGFLTQSGEGSRLEYAITEKGRSVLEDYASLVNRATAPAEVAF